MGDVGGLNVANLEGVLNIVVGRRKGVLHLNSLVAYLLNQPDCAVIQLKGKGGVLKGRNDLVIRDLGVGVEAVGVNHQNGVLENTPAALLLESYCQAAIGVGLV